MRYLLLLFLTLSALAQTRSTVNVGTNPNDGTGDTLRTFGGKVNTNFFQLWASTYTNDIPSVTVGTVPALIARSGKTSQLYATQGYHAQGDGGHGLYRWTNALPAGVITNTGTWFAGVSGYWSLIHDGRVNVRQFGAKGDGVTDDRSALDEAFVAIKMDGNDARGNTLIVPAGQYLVKNQVLWSFASNFTILFEGDAEIVLDPVPDVAVDQIIRVHTVTNATFINVGVNGSGYTGANGIGIGRATGSNKSERVRVFNARIRNCYRSPANSVSPPFNAGGGRAITLQFDVYDTLIDGLVAMDCTTAIDTHGNSNYPIIGADFRNIYALRCEEIGSFYDLLDQNTNEDAQGYNQILIDGVMAVDCGLSTVALESGTTFPSGTMGGLFVFVRARSVTINNVKVHNSSSYGQIGAIARGTGKHIRMRNLDVNADTVALFWLYKAENMLPLNSISDDGIQPYQWRIADVRHTGSTTNVVWANQSVISPPLSQCSFENIDLDVLLGKIVGDGPVLGSGGSSSFLSVREKSTTKTIEGNLSNIQIFHPNFDIVTGVSMARAGHMFINQAMVYASNSTPFLILNRQGTSSGAASIAVNSGSIRFFDEARTTYRYEFPQSGSGVLFAPAGISGGTHVSAAFEVRSTTSGLLPPRMTTAQRDLIATPVDGLMIYNTTVARLQVRVAGVWVDTHLPEITNVAQLIALTPPTGLTVRTLGYYAQGDGGHGLYRWTNALPAGVVTNTGTWFAGVSGYWSLIHDGRVNVRQFGAKGNDSNDDGSAINAALAAMRDVGGLVYLPRGIYLTSISIDARGTSGTTGKLSGLYGDGPSATIIEATGSNYPVVRVTGSYFQMQGMELTYSSLQTGSDSNSHCLSLEDWVFFSVFDQLLLTSGYTGINTIDGDEVSQEPLAFSNEFRMIRVRDAYYAGVRLGRTTGNKWSNLYISAQNRDGVTRMLEIYGKLNETFGQVNLEQAAVRDAALVIHDNSDNVQIQNLHIEGVSLISHGSVTTTEPGGLAGAMVVYAGRGTLTIDGMTLDRIYTGPQPMTLTSSGTTVTATVLPWDTGNSTGSGIRVGDTIEMLGAAETDYNGTFTVASVPSAWTFTYQAGSAPSATPATTGSGVDYITGLVGNAGGVNSLFRTASRPRSISVGAMRIRDVVARGGTSSIRSGALRLLEAGALVECPLYLGAFNYQGQDWQSQMAGTLRVTAGQRSGGTAEAFTLYPHGLGVGDVVRIGGCTAIGGFNGLWTVTAVNNTHSLSFALAGTTAFTYESTGYLIRRDFGTVSRSRTSNISTIVTDAAHSLKVGQRVVIQGMGGTGYSDTETAVLTVPTATSFTYLNTGSDEGTTADTAGTIMVIDVGIAQGTLANPAGSNRLVSAAQFDLLRNEQRSGLSRIRTGSVTLAAGTFVVVDPIAAGSIVAITPQVPGGTPGWLRVSARTDGTSFTITSSDAADTSVAGYVIHQP